MSTSQQPEWADILPPEPPAPIRVPRDDRPPRRMRRTRGEIAYELAQLASREPNTAAPMASEAPLTPDEIAALEKLGWSEFVGQRLSPAGLHLIRLRWQPGRTDSADAEATEEERTPGGWRLLIGSSPCAPKSRT